MDVRDVEVHAYRLICCRRFRIALLGISLRLHALVLMRRLYSACLIELLLLVLLLFGNQLSDFVLSDVYLCLDT